MPKVLIVYYSKSGNTEMMAHEVAKGAKEGGAEVTVSRVEDTSIEDLESSDAIIMGSPTYYGSMAAPIKDLLDRSVKIHGHLNGKVGGAFTSAANIGGGNETTILDMLKAMLIHGMIIKGDHKGDHYGPVAIRQPDERALKECRRMGENVATLTQKIAG